MGPAGRIRGGNSGGDGFMPPILYGNECGIGDIKLPLPPRLNVHPAKCPVKNPDACHDVYENKASYAKFGRFSRKWISLIQRNLLWQEGQAHQKKGNSFLKVSPTMLLKTHVEKMSLIGYATMSMNTK